MNKDSVQMELLWQIPYAKETFVLVDNWKSELPTSVKKTPHPSCYKGAQNRVVEFSTKICRGMEHKLSQVSGFLMLWNPKTFCISFALSCAKRNDGRSNEKMTEERIQIEDVNFWSSFPSNYVRWNNDTTAYFPGRMPNHLIWLHCHFNFDLLVIL